MKKGASITLSVKVEGKWVDMLSLCVTLELHKFMKNSGLSLVQIIVALSPLSGIWDSPPKFIRDFVCFTAKLYIFAFISQDIENRDNDTY